MIARTLLRPLLAVALALAATAPPASAQDPLAPQATPDAPEAGTDEPTPPPEGPKTPREVFRRFDAATSIYAESGDKEELHRAGRLFELDDVLKGDREYVGDNAARDLRNFLDRSVEKVPFDKSYRWRRAADDDKTYVYEARYRDAEGNVQSAEILLRKDEYGNWRFARETRQAAAELFGRVTHLEPRFGAGLRDATTWLRDHAPAWMHGRTFLLDHWQWVGLVGLILGGLIVSVLTRLLTMALRAWILARRGMKAESNGWRRSRPFGVMAAAAAWSAGLPFLLLADAPYSALMFAVRLVLMVGATWSVCSIIDYASEFLSSLASQTATRIDDVVIPMVRRALKILVVAIGIVWIADNLDMDVAALLAGLSIGGLALALAARDTVENFFGTVSILADRPFEVGDWIVMDDVEGTVETVGFRSTRVRTFYNSLITVPNALMTRAKIDNLGAREYRRVKETIGITYDTPPDLVVAFCEGIREIIRKHPYTRKDYYHVYFHSYGDSSLNILLYLFLATPDWATELRERERFLLDIARLAEELGVDFAFPSRTLYMVESEGTPERRTFDSAVRARRTGRTTGRAIAHASTGGKVPPPVDMTKDARDAQADDVGEGASGDAGGAGDGGGGE
ncbi:MAG: mechanosensitive ion channel family protein [Planctomycetota bacterium JB042]